MSTVSNIRIPTYVNAVELAEFVMEKRKGARVDYDNSNTSPTLDEINDRLIASEMSVSKQMNNQWRPDRYTFETIWMPYGRPLYGTYSHRENFNRKAYMPVVKLLHHPIISIDKLQIIYGDTEIDLIADPATYPEGWNGAYYIDYTNGTILFRNYVPEYQSPIKIEYTHGRYENEWGEVIKTGTITDDVDHVMTETIIYAELNSKKGKYNGKLLKITSGDCAGEVYRIYESDMVEKFTSIRVLDGYTMVTDGIDADDTFEIYAIPQDIQEMIKIYTYVGILSADPTYQHNFENPFEEPNPQYEQINLLHFRFFTLLDQRKNTMQLLN